MSSPNALTTLQNLAVTLSKHDLAGVVALFAPGITWSEPDLSLQGPDAVRTRLGEWISAFPDLSLSLSDACGQEDLALAETMWAGTQRESFSLPGGSPLPPTEQQLHLVGSTVLKLENGQVAEWRQYYDRISLRAQLEGGTAHAAPKQQAGESTIHHIGRLYRFHFRDPRRERLFLASVSFFLTFSGVRIMVHDIRDDRGPFHNITPGGKHIHHLVWGILLLLATGYAWLAQIGTGMVPPRNWMRSTAVLYGSGAALTLDEFALWLNLEDVYWTKQGRESIDAVALFGGLLSIAFWGGPFFRGVYRFLRDVAHRLV